MANASSRRLSALRTHLTPHPCRSDSPAPAVAAQQASADADPDDAPPSIQDMFDMSGRVAIVTGGGTHLGLAMATTLLELGAVVVLASRRVELCEEEAAKLREGGQGYRCYAARCDVTVEEDVEALVKDVVAEHGRLDVMVCNAGGSAATSYIPNASVEEFSATYDMNVKSTYMCAQSAARHAMIAQRSGKIITLGSIHGILSGDLRLYDGLEGFNRSGPPYQAAKGAVVNLTRSLAVELAAHGIQVNCLSPGQIPKMGTHLPEMVERTRQMNPLQVTGRSRDIKGAVALLSSEASDWLTGQNLVVDGGWSIW